MTTTTDDRALPDKTPVPYSATRLVDNQPRVLVCWQAAGWRRVGTAPDGRAIIAKDFVVDREARRAAKP